MSTITTNDGAEIYCKDWGVGPVVAFSQALMHGTAIRAGVLKDHSQYYKDFTASKR